MDKWEVITKPDQAGHGIYQEKFIIIAHEPADDIKLRELIKREYPEAEKCDVPPKILSMYPQAFGFWVNKHDPKCSIEDLKAGNIRKKIN